MAEPQTPTSSVRKTQARIAERERRRAQRERAQKLKTTGFIVIGVVAALALAYGIFAAFVAPAIAPARDIQGTTGPRFQVDREALELGHRVFNQPVRAAFNVKNAGDGTLKVSTPSLVTALEGC